MTAVDHDIVDPEREGLDGYVPPPYVPPATLDERLVTAWREVTRTPGRAALAMVDLCALAGFVVSLRPVPITAVDATGPLRARCGLSFYLSGASNRAVATACHYAFSSRVPMLLLLGLLVVGSSGLLTYIILRPAVSPNGGYRQWWRAITSSPTLAALAVFDLAALVALIVAAGPVNVATADAAGPLRASCGLQYFVFGTSNSAVQDACRHAYGPRATAFFALLAVWVAGVLMLHRLTKRVVTPPRS